MPIWGIYKGISMRRVCGTRQVKDNFALDSHKIRQMMSGGGV